MVFWQLSHWVSIAKWWTTEWRKHRRMRRCLQLGRSITMTASDHLLNNLMVWMALPQNSSPTLWERELLLRHLKKSSMLSPNFSPREKTMPLVSLSIQSEPSFLETLTDWSKDATWPWPLHRLSKTASPQSLSVLRERKRKLHKLLWCRIWNTETQETIMSLKCRIWWNINHWFLVLIHQLIHQDTYQSSNQKFLVKTQQLTHLN